MKKIPFVDLYPQYLELKDEIDAAIESTIRNCSFIQGKPVKEFEQALAAWTGSAHAVSTANCTSAGWIALKALNIGPGDEVITTPLTAIPTAEYMTLAGAAPVFADIDPATYQLSPEAAEAAITPRTKAIIPVHLYGIPADIEKFLEIGKRHNLPIIEDCAQAQGARVGNTMVGRFGLAALWSFFPSKNLGCFGDGGALTTDDEALAKYVRMFSNHGRLEKFTHEMPGANERLDGLQAAILTIKLRKLDEWNARRRAIADRYNELLANVEEIVTPKTYPNATPVWHLYVVRAPKRDDLMKALKERGIATGLHYPLPLHEQPAMSFAAKSGGFPETEKACREIVSLPMYPHMPVEDVDIVVNAVKEVLAQSRIVIPAG